jgi:hypothetical protein
MFQYVLVPNVRTNHLAKPSDSCCSPAPTLAQVIPITYTESRSHPHSIPIPQAYLELARLISPTGTEYRWRRRDPNYRIIAPNTASRLLIGVQLTKGRMQ